MVTIDFFLTLLDLVCKAINLIEDKWRKGCNPYPDWIPNTFKGEHHQLQLFQVMMSPLTLSQFVSLNGWLECLYSDTSSPWINWFATLPFHSLLKIQSLLCIQKQSLTIQYPRWMFISTQKQTGFQKEFWLRLKGNVVLKMSFSFCF